MWFRGTVFLCAMLFPAFPPSAAAQVPFHIETVDADGNTGISASLALDSQGRPHIAYIEALSQTIRYTLKTGATWNSKPGPGYADLRSSVTLVLDAADNPGITHVGVYYRRVGSTWVSEYMGGFAPWFSTVAQDVAGGLHGVTIWSWGSGEYKGYVSYTVRVGGTWPDEIFTDGTFLPSLPHAALAIDRNGDPHISLTATYGDSVRYWHRTNGAWSQVVLTPGAWCSIALDGQDAPRISYYDTVQSDLVLAFQHNGAWVTLPLDASGDVGQYTSQEIRGDVSHITYYTASLGDLRYAMFSPTEGAQGLLVQTVDAEGDVGAWTSLVLDGQGQPHIAYHDVGNGDLKYASAAVQVPAKNKTVGGVKWLYRR
jgi:hypothetical protein